MRLLQLQNETLNAIKASKIRGIKKLLDVNIDLLTAQTIVAVDNATLNFIPFTATACLVGDRVTRGMEVTKQNRFRFGAFLIECLANNGVVRLTKDKKQQHFLEVTDILGMADLVWSVRASLKELSPDLSVLPQFEKPEPFKSFFHPIAGEMVRGLNRSQQSHFKRKMVPEVYQTINKAIETPWKVSTELLSVLEQCKEDDIFTFADKGFDDKQRESNVYAYNSTLEVAKMVGDKTFWNYCYYDSRGRLYYTTHYLNLQGSKLAKSLLRYASSEAIGASGLNFLKAQVVSAYGEDKLSLEAKIEYFNSHADEWLVWADDAVNNKEWQKADDPFNFLASLLDIAEALKLEDPREYESSLPIHLDASCSGLMILSALSRDEKSGVHCNLTETDERGDYYLHVADHCSVFDKDEFWSQHKAKRRKIVKRQAMIFFYSAKAKCMSETIWQDWRSELPGLRMSDCSALGNQIYQACRELMPGPAKLMDMMIEAGVKAYNENKHYHLDLPNGFRMHQNYTVDRSTQVKTYFQGKEIKCRVVLKRGHKIDYSKVKSASAPNVVHSLDAQLVAKAITENSYLTTTIHDSFSCHAANASSMYNDLRMQFKAFFEGLELEGYDFPKGELNLEFMLDNEYCYA